MSEYRLDIPRVNRAFLSACSALNLLALETLVEMEGLDVNSVVDHVGQNGIHFVVCNAKHNLDRQIQVFKFLVENGADVNKVRSVDGWTPIFLPVAFGIAPLVSLLIQHGAKTKIRDYAGLSPEDWADRYRHKRIKDLLVHSRSKVPHSRFTCVMRSPALSSPSPPTSTSSTSSSSPPPTPTSTQEKEKTSSTTSTVTPTTAAAAAAAAAATTTGHSNETEPCMLKAQ